MNARNRRRWEAAGAALLAAAVLAMGLFYIAAGESRQRGIETVIIHTNDSHGRGAGDEEQGIMGFAAVTALKKEYEAKGDNVLVLDAGDTFHGLPFASLRKGGDIVTLMNMTGYDAMTPGNHDFNYGSERLLELSAQAEFPLLSANVIYQNGGNTFLEPMTVIEKRGIRYGIFGLTTPEINYKTSPEKISGLEISDPVDRAQFCVEQLKQRKADYIIGLMHMGTDPASEYTSARIAGEVEGIDLIIDGHSHSLFENGMMEGDTMIVSAGEWLKGLGVVTIAANGDMEAKVLDAKQYGGRDPGIEAAVNQIVQEEEPLLKERIGNAAVLLDGERETVRRKESNLGDWAADVVREASGADVVYLTGGGIRATISEGAVTREGLLTAFPFGNTIVVKEVSGAVLTAALEHGLADTPDLSGAYPQVSGIQVTYDSRRTPGSRIMEVLVAGVPLQQQRTYAVAMTDHVAAGGDDYRMFSELPDIREFDSMEELLAEDLKRHDSVGRETDKRLIDMVFADEKETEVDE